MGVLEVRKCRGWPWWIPLSSVVQVVAKIHMTHDDWLRGSEVPASWEEARGFAVRNQDLTAVSKRQGGIHTTTWACMVGEADGEDGWPPMVPVEGQRSRGLHNCAVGSWSQGDGGDGEMDGWPRGTAQIHQETGRAGVAASHLTSSVVAGEEGERIDDKVYCGCRTGRGWDAGCPSAPCCLPGGELTMKAGFLFWPRAIKLVLHTSGTGETATYGEKRSFLASSTTANSHPTAATYHHLFEPSPRGPAAVIVSSPPPPPGTRERAA